MVELGVLAKTLLRVFREWGRKHPTQLNIYAGMALGGALLVIITMSGVFDSSDQTPEAESVPESVVTVEVLATPSVEQTVEPTEEPEIDVAFAATVELASCESEVCELPVWQTHERNVLIGTVPEGDTVDVISCFYPLIRQELSEGGETEEPEFNSYTIEGLWCETYYLDSGGDVIKGVTQYWNLSVIEAEGLEDAGSTTSG